MADDEIKLILDVKGTGAIKDLQENLAYTRSTLDQLKNAYAAGELTTEQYLQMGGKLSRQERELAETLAAVDAEQQRLNADLLKSLAGYDAVDAAMEEMEESSKRAAAAMNKVGDAAGSAASKSAGVSNAALQLSRGVEDFATGGFLGILNNIPGIFQGIGAALGLAAGPLAAFIAAVSLLSTGAYILYKNWESVLGLFESRNAIPAATTSLERHEAALKKVNESLDAMKEKTSLNYDELKKFKDLQQEQADLEDKLAQDRKNEANEKAHNEHANRADRDAAGGFAKALDEAGGYKLVVDRFTNQLALQLKATEDEVPGLREAIKKQFTAALAGDRGAIGTIKATAAGDATGLTGMFDTFIDMHSPETKIRQEKEKKAREKAENDAIKSQELINEFENPALADKALADIDKPKDKIKADIDRDNKAGLAAFEKEEADRLKEQQRKVGAQVDQEDASIKGGGYDVFARGLTAEMNARGGGFDRTGAFHKMTPEQIREFVAGQVARQLRARNRGMDGQQAEDVATKVSLEAQADVTSKLTGMGAAQATNTQKLLMIAGQSQAELERLMNVVAHQGQQIDQVVRRGKARSRTNLKR